MVRVDVYPGVGVGIVGFDEGFVGVSPLLCEVAPVGWGHSGELKPDCMGEGGREGTGGAVRGGGVD